MTRELRKKERQAISCEIYMAWQDSSGRRRFCEAEGKDLSELGLRVESPVPLELDFLVRVSVGDDGSARSARVRHCRCRGSRHMIGLEFVRPSARPAEEVPQDEFVDFYEFMEISPTAEVETIRRVYRLMASRYHPDNVHTGDLRKFLLLQEAIATLSDPARRTAYDAEYRARRTAPMPIFELRDFVVGIDAETNRRLGILCLLYNRRRTSPDKPGLSLLEFEQLMTIPREHLLFPVWYLKEKQLLRTEGNAEFEITADGVGFVEASLPSNRLLQRLLRAPAAGSETAVSAEERPAA